MFHHIFDHISDRSHKNANFTYKLINYQIKKIISRPPLTNKFTKIVVIHYNMMQIMKAVSIAVAVPAVAAVKGKSESPTSIPTAQEKLDPEVDLAEVGKTLLRAVHTVKKPSSPGGSGKCT